MSVHTKSVSGPFDTCEGGPDCPPVARRSLPHPAIPVDELSCGTLTQHRITFFMGHLILNFIAAEF